MCADPDYRQQPGARPLGDRAGAVLVFPNITQAGLWGGGLYGNGVMFQNGQPVGYYNIAGGTFGFRAEAQTCAQSPWRDATPQASQGIRPPRLSHL